jgi:hypothetical protein
LARSELLPHRRESRLARVLLPLLLLGMVATLRSLMLPLFTTQERGWLDNFNKKKCSRMI